MRYGGKMRPLLALAGAYLLYLAFRQIELAVSGAAETRGQVIICVVSAAVFAAVGVWVLWREWTRKANDSNSDSTPDDSSTDWDSDNSGDDLGSDDSDDSE